MQKTKRLIQIMYKHVLVWHVCIGGSQALLGLFRLNIKEHGAVSMRTPNRQPNLLFNNAWACQVSLCISSPHGCSSSTTSQAIKN